MSEETVAYILHSALRDKSWHALGDGHSNGLNDLVIMGISKIGKRAW